MKHNRLVSRHHPSRTQHRRAAGFSLIELLLVLVILGVLVGIVVTKFTGRSEQARIVAARADLSAIETALDAFEIDNGRFPTSAEGLETLLAAPAEMPNWRGPYLKKLPIDPWGGSYLYEQPGRFNTTGFDLSSAGPDRQEGNDDDISNWTKY